jgi:hypothetical protein
LLGDLRFAAMRWFCLASDVSQAHGDAREARGAGSQQELWAHVRMSH